MCLITSISRLNNIARFNLERWYNLRKLVHNNLGKELRRVSTSYWFEWAIAFSMAESEFSKHSQIFIVTGAFFWAFPRYVTLNSAHCSTHHRNTLTLTHKWHNTLQKPLCTVSATPLCIIRANSISAVDNRCPDTLITSTRKRLLDRNKKMMMWMTNRQHVL